MDRVGAPPALWLLCCQHVAYILNRTSSDSLEYRTPYACLHGWDPDISMIPIYTFYEPVYFNHHGPEHYPSASNEQLGRFVGFSETVGHALTFKVLHESSSRVLYRSRLRSAQLDGEKNLRAQTPNEPSKGKTQEITDKTQAITGDKDHETESGTTGITQDGTETDIDGSPIQSPPPNSDSELRDEDYDGRDIPEDEENPKPPLLESTTERRRRTGELLCSWNPEDLIGRTFQLPEVDGIAEQATIKECVDKYARGLSKHPELVRFKCTVNDKELDNLISYGQIMKSLEPVDNHPINDFKVEKIYAHRGPLRASDPGYLGSSYNLLVKWQSGRESTEPLTDFIGSHPVDVFLYAKANNLLNTRGWLSVGKRKEVQPLLSPTDKEIMKRPTAPAPSTDLDSNPSDLSDTITITVGEHQGNPKVDTALINKASKISSSHFNPIFMYGIQVPRNHNEALRLDKENGNTKWQDAERVELDSIFSYEAFKDTGHKSSTKPPDGYKKITVHMVYAIKHDGRHKARLVAGGHLTEAPTDSVYSSVVSLRGVRMVMFIAELNGLEIWSTDVGNAYLESLTQEKVYIIAGSEFAPLKLEGHVLVIHKALYGLKSSGLRWWERLSDVLRDEKDGLDFFPSRTETDIWMRKMKNHYEYICVYVDDLIICSRHPKRIIDKLEKDHCFKLKGTGPIEFHLGCDYFRDQEGTLCYGPKKYIGKLIDEYEREFGDKPKRYSSPLERGDHPELDTSKLLDMRGIKQYQSLIGSLQWVVQLGRFDITTAVMTMSGFRSAPRVGHLDRVKRIVGYLRKMDTGVVRIRTGQPDYSGIGEQRHDWDYSIYKGATEIIPQDIPTPLGKSIVLTSYVDANLYHDMVTGRSVTGVLHLVNQTPFDWFSKKQPTVETATYGSEFVAARTATEQIMANRGSFRYLGVDIIGPTIMFGDNKSVVTSSTVPQSPLSKRHVALSYHRVREAIAGKLLQFHWIESDKNPADILSKHWGYQQIWGLMKPLLFWYGDTESVPTKRVKMK